MRADFHHDANWEMYFNLNITLSFLELQKEGLRQPIATAINFPPPIVYLSRLIPGWDIYQSQSFGQYLIELIA